MLIRSQNKKRIININTIDAIQIEEDNSIFAKSGIYHFLGEYSTKEKALKVLDMIEEEYLEPTYISCFSDMEYAKHEHKVFHMPQEDEVIL